MEPVLTRHESETTLYKENGSWIEKVFQKRECDTFIASTKDRKRCGCGRLQSKHFANPDVPAAMPPAPGEKWMPQYHSEASSTDAYGTVEFQGGPHPTKAQYVRLSHDTPPEMMLQLLQKHWNLGLPKLVISVHGGIANFELQPKLQRVFRKGLLKAAKTTGAWIVSAGINTGVVRHVGDSLGDTLVQARNHIVTLGVAPWGVVHNRRDLIGRDCVTPYHSIGAPKTNSVVLNSNHAYFLLVDNGSVGKYGCEILLRKKLEKYIQQQKITNRSGTKNYTTTPVLCLVLEGGTNTIRTVIECITDTPPVPVVVCDGSGRAADLLAFTHKYAQDDGTMPETLRDQLILTVERTFQYTREQAGTLFMELMLCVKKKELITVFRMGEDSQDIDLAILTALLKAQNASCTDQLSLALAWNRVDIARSHIFLYGQEWPDGALDQAMLEALVNDRVDFVKLLIENGVSMQKWLTISRLEELYNIKQDPSSTLRYLVRDNKKNIPANYRYNLADIGLVIEQLMGGAYRASFCRKWFKSMYNAIMKKYSDFDSDQNSLYRKSAIHKGMGHHISNIISELPVPIESLQDMHVFKYPFHELMVWAVLMKRQKMAIFMWQHGEEALAKALIACKLYKSMAHEAAQDDLEEEISLELKTYAREFVQLALDLLEQCFKTDDDLTQQLLTYELKEWSDQTCLSLAVSANHREFIAHTCCQILLTEMWMGALRMRKYTSLKVILGILFFPSVLCLEFKSKEELQLMPQTVEEHIQELEDSDSDSDSSVSSVTSIAKARLAQQEALVNAKQSAGLANGALFADLSHTFQATKKSPLRLGQKISEFYTAPITKFWAHTFGYAIFLVVCTYTVLVKMERLPNWLEWYSIAYILTLILEKLREIIVSEPKKCGQKLYVYYTEVWNICDAIAIILFVVGCTLRFLPPSLDLGKVFYCVAIVFWYIRLLDIFSVSKYLGPYVTMIGKMMKDMLYFIVILLIVMMSFGVVRQAITYPNEKPNWSLVKGVFLKPYFMIYGEVYANEIDPDKCVDELDPSNPDDILCTPGRFIVPAIMSVYLIVANILLINLLIAVFNNTFYQVNAISTQVWKFQRYSLVIEYECKPILPPPFIFLCHLYLIVRFFIQQCRGKRHPFDNGLKLFLEKDEVEKMHDFEEEAMEDLFRHKDDTYHSSADERIRLTNERVENMSLRLDDINQKENNVRLLLQTVDYRMLKLEELVVQSLGCMDKLQHSISQISLVQPVSMSHDGSRPMHEASPHSAPIYLQKSPMPEVKHVASQASRFEFAPQPQRKKSRNEERLRPFTDYSNKLYHRPPLNRSITVGNPVSLGKELEEIYTNFSTMQGSTLQGLINDAKPKSSLYERRRKKPVIQNSRKDGPRAGGSLEFCPLDEHQELMSCPNVVRTGTRVTFSDTRIGGISMDQEPNSQRKLSLPIKIPQTTTHGAYSATQAKNAFTKSSMKFSSHVSDDLGIAPDLPTSDMTEKWVENSLEMATVPKMTSAINTASKFAVQSVVPIITPNRVEYTTITDDIDTSCLNYCSPRGSPTTPKPPTGFGFNVNLDLYTKKENPKKTHARNAESEAQQLKSAEEAEHEQMEMVLRKRMRQISLTDRDSMGDIATRFIQEIDTSSSSSSDAEPAYYSDEETKRDRQNGFETSERIRHVSSEPIIKLSISPSLIDQCANELKCKSQSPLGGCTSAPTPPNNFTFAKSYKVADNSSVC